MRGLLFLAVFLLVAAAPVPPPAPEPAPAPPPAPEPAPAPISRAEAQAALSVLENPESRDAFIATLRTIVQGTEPAVPEQHATAEPASSASAAASNTSAEASKEPAGAEAKPGSKPVVPLAPDSLGAQSLIHFSAALSAVRDALWRAFRAVISLSLLSIWIATIKADPFVRQQFLEFAWRVIVVVVLGLVVERATSLALRRPRRSLLHLARRERALARLLARRAKLSCKARDRTARGARAGAEFRSFSEHARSLLLAFGGFALALPPIALFAAVAYGLVETKLGAPEVPRLAILAIVNAYVITRFALCVVRFVLADPAREFRLLPTNDAGAAYANLWALRIIAVSVFGYGTAEVALLLGLYPSLHLALIKLIALVVHIFVAVIILEQRRAVRRLIAPPANASGWAASLRRLAARTWHYVAIFYVIALWLLWAIGVPNGFMTLFRFLITVAVVTVAAWAVRRSLARVLERQLRPQKGASGRYPGYERRTRRYVRLAQQMLSLVISVIAFLVLLESWGVDVISWFTSGGFGGRVIGALVVVAVTIAVALFVWEATNAAIERHLARLARDGQAARAARINTLLPMLRATLIVAIVVFVGLTALSEIGINIAPLLAGAGVVGIAIGFGSQKLVQDVITGVFLLFENAMQVGDVVTLGGLSGVVENVSVRSIRLRDSDGSVYLIPFSAVTTVANQTRDFGYAVFNVSVAYEEDSDRVVAVLKDIVREMRSEPEWRTRIKDDLEVWGLDKLSGTAQVIACRVQTGPADRWAVAREFNRRMKQRFDELGIAMSYPTQKLVMEREASRYSEHEEKRELPRGMLR